MHELIHFQTLTVVKPTYKITTESEHLSNSALTFETSLWSSPHLKNSTIIK